MSGTELSKPFRGIIPPMVTPLAAQDELDLPGLERLIARMLNGGVHGLFILGTTGEAPSLSYRLRREVIKETCRLVAGRVPVIVGVTDTSYVETMDLSRAAADAGAQGLVIAPPYYFPAGQPELLEYIEHIAPALPLPVFLYNMPSHTKVVIEPETVKAALAIPNVVGLKDSSGSMTYFHKLQMVCAERRDFALLVGPEELLAESVLLGAHGGVNGGANLFPELYVKLYSAAMNGDLAMVNALHKIVMRISATIYCTGKHATSYLKGLKCALSLEGVCEDRLAEPFQHFLEPERRRIAAYLGEIKQALAGAL